MERGPTVETLPRSVRRLACSACVCIAHMFFYTSWSLASQQGLLPGRGRSASTFSRPSSSLFYTAIISRHREGKKQKNIPKGSGHIRLSNQGQPVRTMLLKPVGWWCCYRLIFAGMIAPVRRRLDVGPAINARVNASLPLPVRLARWTHPSLPAPSCSPATGWDDPPLPPQSRPW